MISTLLAVSFALTLPPAGEEKLAITNLRFTYGYLGTERKAEFLPGEKVFLAYNVENMKLDKRGRAEYKLSMKVEDSEGNILVQGKPDPKVAINYLGGNTFPSVGKGDIPLDLPPGEYTIHLSLEDTIGKKSTTSEIKAKVLPKAFGIIHVEPCGDIEGQVPSSPICVMGESLYINFAAVGFDRDKASKDAHLSVSMRILDKNGKPTMPEPLTGVAKEGIPKSFQIIPLQFAFTLNRIGEYTVELNAKDEISGKTSQVTFPVKVISLN